MLSSRKAISIISASAIALGTCIPAGLAFADPDPVDPPSVGDQSGAGSTAMTMVWDNADQEYGGTEDPNNPPSDPNDPTSPGENLAFKAPTAINFVAKANGDLIAPSYSAVYLENFSASGIHVSSMQIEQGTGWNIVEDAASSANTANAVWGKIGPYNEKLNWYDHKIKADVTTASKWGMAAAGAANDQSKLFLATEGKFANLNIDLSEAKTFGTIHWYLKMGGEGQRAVDPEDIHTLNKLTVASANGGFKLRSSLAAAAVSEDLGEAVEGDTVYIVAEPDSGYVVDEMTVTTTESDEEVEVTRNVGGDANVGSFVMPEEAVDVEVTFSEPGLLDIFPLATMQADSSTLRGSTATAEEKAILVNKYLPYVQAGETLTVDLANNHGSTTIRFIDVNTEKGLVFMFTEPLPAKAAHHDSETNLGGWNASDIRASLNSGGTLYSTYLNGMKINGSVVSPSKVTNMSLDYNGGTTRNLSTDVDGDGPEDDGDVFWLASTIEIYGTNGNWTNITSVEQGSQFTYYANLGITDNKNRNLLVSTTSGWWLRSAGPNTGTTFVNVASNGSIRCGSAAASLDIIPCFAL